MFKNDEKIGDAFLPALVEACRYFCCLYRTSPFWLRYGLQGAQFVIQDDKVPLNFLEMHRMHLKLMERILSQELKCGVYARRDFPHQPVREMDRASPRAADIGFTLM